MGAVTDCSDFGAQENKIYHSFYFFPILAMKWWPDAMILVFWKLNFKPTFSLSSVTCIKRLFSCTVRTQYSELPVPSLPYRQHTPPPNLWPHTFLCSWKQLLIQLLLFMDSSSIFNVLGLQPTSLQETFAFQLTTSFPLSLSCSHSCSLPHSLSLSLLWMKTWF